jgi:hypothetical protein
MNFQEKKKKKGKCNLTLQKEFETKQNGRKHIGPKY